MVIRLGEVDRYNVVLALQYILQAQVGSLLGALAPEGGDDAVRAAVGLAVRKIWILFISTLGIDYDEDELLEGPPAMDAGRHEVSAAGDASTPRSASPAPSSSAVVSMELLDEILNSQPATIDAKETPQLPPPKRSFPYAGTVNKKPIERVGPVSLLAIIYLGLLETGVPVLVADLRRLLVRKVLPYGDAAVREAIPTALRREVEAKRWDVIFRPKACRVISCACLTSARPLPFPPP